MRRDSPDSVLSPYVLLGLVLLAMLHTLSGPSASADDAFPYVATIASAEAAVKSGPAEEFYDTDRLTKGQQVEVYRHDADGWCAIRPPENSFSWVPAEHLELTDDPTLATVINVPVKTRIGSRFSDIHDVEYISLRKGETVQLLGSKALRESQGGTAATWFQVAPPSGEFRWVHASHFQQTSQPAVANQAVANQANPNQTVANQAVGQLVGHEPIPTFDLQPEAEQQTALSGTSEEKVAATAFTEIESAVKTASYQEQGDAAPTSNPDSIVTGSGVDHTEPGHAHVNVVTWEAVAAPTEVLTAPEPRSFEDRYRALNLMLSRAVLDDIGHWQFDHVKRQTELLLNYAETPDEQDLASSLLTKIDEFDALKQRSTQLRAKADPALAQVSYQEVSEPASNSSTPATDVATLPTGPEMPNILNRNASRPAAPIKRLQRHDAVDNAIFDASGMLIAVHSRRADMPKFALTDSDGSIVQFVTSTRPLDLRRHVNQRVGILGQVGYIASLSKPSIVADRIVPLVR